MSKKIKVLISFSVILLVILIYSCVEKFMPELKSTNVIIVIDGSIIKGDSIQVVKVSYTSTIDNPSFNPVSGCLVSVSDNNGNDFLFTESSEGVYTYAIPEHLLSYNSTYQLYVKTSNGKEYQSEPEKIMESSPIDSIYYEIESNQTASEKSYKGLQFYADLKAPEGATKNYRWTVEETWEIHTLYDIGAYYVRHLDTIIYRYINDSINVCWSTREIKEIYASSTESLLINEKKKIPLNYLEGTDTKLRVRYSALVKQYSLSKTAFEYWSAHQAASTETGSLYESQPLQSQSNIININNPNEKVLGIFYGSSYTEKRLFFRGPLVITDDDINCSVVLSTREKLYGLGIDTVFLIKMPDDPFAKMPNGDLPLNQLCIDCTFEGGTTKRPDFWGY